VKRKIKGLSQTAIDAFKHYEWRGNVRELKNVIERALILEDSEYITLTYLPRDLTTGHETIHTKDTPAGGFALPPNGISLDDIEMSLVKQAIDRSGGNQTRAAELLGISRDQLRYRLKKLEEAQSRGA
jgi:DNA-binding NtrC family response regulator